MSQGRDEQDERYLAAAAEYGAALDRLARAYEADADRRCDLVQDIHVGLWRSFAGFDGRCSVRTWVYRVAHNAATSHILTQKRLKLSQLVSLDQIADAPDADNPEANVGGRQALERLMALIHQLKPSDRQIMLLYLEDLDAASIAEIAGVSPGAAAVKIHRIKAVLVRRFQEGAAS